MEFREDIGQYVFEYEGLIFAWDEEPEEDIQDTVKTLANNYFKHLDGIIDFMLPDIKKIEFLLPSNSEQTAIATILSDMDTELAALQAQLTKARHIKQGMMQELLTGRIRLL